MSSKLTNPQFVAVDEDTAHMIKYIAKKTDLPVEQLMKSVADILRYGMGRKVTIEGKRKVVEVTFEDYEALVDIDD